MTTYLNFPGGIASRSGLIDILDERPSYFEVRADGADPNGPFELPGAGTNNRASDEGIVPDCQELSLEYLEQIRMQGVLL